MGHVCFGEDGAVRRFSILTAVVAVCSATLVLGACGLDDGAQESASDVTSSAPTTTTQAAPSTTPSTATQPAPSGDATATSSPTPDVAAVVAIADIEAAVYADIAARYADSQWNTVYPGTLDCGYGSVAVGSALGCSYIPDEVMEFAGPLVIVLDAERIVWTQGVCCGGAPAPEDYPAGSFCRDLARPPADSPRSALPDGSLAEPSADYHLSYGLAVWYWYAAGRPDRMDADLDGIPCETVYDSDEIEAFWDSVIPLG